MLLFWIKVFSNKVIKFYNNNKSLTYAPPTPFFLTANTHIILCDSSAEASQENSGGGFFCHPSLPLMVSSVPVPVTIPVPAAIVSAFEAVSVPVSVSVAVSALVVAVVIWVWSRSRGAVAACRAPHAVLFTHVHPRPWIVRHLPNKETEYKVIHTKLTEVRTNWNKAVSILLFFPWWWLNKTA